MARTLQEAVCAVLDSLSDQSLEALARVQVTDSDATTTMLRQHAVEQLAARRARAPSVQHIALDVLTGR